MKEITGDLWTVAAKYRVITTNGVVKANGELVMGKGVALEAVKRFPFLPKYLGRLVKEQGNRPYIINGLISFPTKNHWKGKSDIGLIRESAVRIVELADTLKLDDIAMPRPGCGCGGLKWPDVKAVIEPILDDRFTIVSN